MLLLPLSLAAQAPPDAGRLLRENALPSPMKSEAPALVIEAPKGAAQVLTAGSEELFTISQIKLTGATKFADAQLRLLLNGLTGRPIALKDLLAGADRITAQYHSHGYMVARAYVPAQFIENGEVEIVILEGKLGRVEVNSNKRNPRVPKWMLAGIADNTIAPDQVIEQGTLERIVLLINDLPAVEARASLRPSALGGSSDLSIDTTEGPIANGSLEVDNFGNRYTGTLRGGAALNLNSPLHLGDLADISGTFSGGQDYGHVSYQLPFFLPGLDVGVAYSQLHYSLCCNFTALHAEGRANVDSVYAQYSIIRGRALSLYQNVGFDYKDFVNQTIAGTVSRYHSSAGTFALSADSVDNLGNGGYTNLGLSVSAGSLDLNGSPNQTTDAASAKTAGTYIRFNLRASRLQTISNSLSFYAAGSGQLSSKNLDTSEQIFLGGSNGVRAYPQGEAPGDQGAIVNLELRWTLLPELQLAGFLDGGFIDLHHHIWSGWQGGNLGLKNEYTLSGAGAGVTWQRPNNFLLRGSAARQLGSNPGLTSTGEESDGKHRETYFLLQLIKYL